MGTSRDRGIGVYSRNQLKALMGVDEKSTYVLYENDAHSPPDLLELPLDRYELRSPSIYGRKNIPQESFLMDSFIEGVSRRTIGAIQESCVDIYHVTSPMEASTYSPIKIPGIPTVCTIYDVIPLLNPAVYLVHPLTSPHYRRCLAQISSMDRILTISSSAKKDLINMCNIPKDKIDVIYAGVSPHFRNIHSPDNFSRVRSKYSTGSNFVIVPAPPDPHKNLERLLEAFAAIPSSVGRDFNLVVVFKGDSRSDQLISLADRYGIKDKIRITGYVPEEDLVSLYNAATCSILPSLYEGFGLPVAESLACGTPAVTSNTSSLPEVLGEGGILVDPYSIESIASGLTLILSDKNLRRDLSAKGLTHVKKFTWESVAKKTLESYTNAVTSGFTSKTKYFYFKDTGSGLYAVPAWA